MLVFLLVSVTIEAIALVAVAEVLRRKGLLQQFSAYAWYLWCVAISDVTYVILRGMYLLSFLSYARSGIYYCVAYNALFAIQCLFIFVLVRDLYRHATAHLPGMESLGSLIFYGSILVSGVMALGAVASPHPAGYSAIAIVLLQLERSSCILVLCLFTFFAFTAQKLGLSYGSRVFGVTFGMAILATDRLVATALRRRSTTGQSLIAAGRVPKMKSTLTKPTPLSTLAPACLRGCDCVHPCKDI